MPFYNGASGKVPLRMQCVLLLGVDTPGERRCSEFTTNDVKGFGHICEICWLDAARRPYAPLIIATIDERVESRWDRRRPQGFPPWPSHLT